MTQLSDKKERPLLSLDVKSYSVSGKLTLIAIRVVIIDHELSNLKGTKVISNNSIRFVDS